MKRLKTLTTSNSFESKKHKDNMCKLFEYVFKDPDFVNQVQKLREDFNIPVYGYKTFPKVTEKLDAASEERNIRKFHNLMALRLSPAEFRKRRIKAKSRNLEFRRKVKQLRLKYEFTITCQSLFEDLIIYGHFIPEGITPVLINVYDDFGEVRIFLEVFGNTHKSDLENAWSLIEELKKEHKLLGHDFKYVNKHKTAIKIKNKKPVDKTGEEIVDDKFDQDYAKDNIDKFRYKKRLEKITPKSHLV